MLKTPFLAMVAVRPLLNPLEPNPCSLTICLVTNHVLGTSFPLALLAINVTFTTSNGFTNMASVIPAPSPANENT